MGKSRANQYQRSPFIAALLSGLGDYFGSDVSAAVPEAGPTPSGASLDEGQPHFKANNFLAKPRARELEQQYQMQQLLGQLGVKNAVQQATQISPIETARAIATAKGLNVAEAEQYARMAGVKADPTVMQNELLALTNQGKGAAQNAKLLGESTLPTNLTLGNAAVLNRQDILANPDNLENYNKFTVEPGISAAALRMQQGEATADSGINKIKRDEEIANATHRSALDTGVNLGEIGLAKSIHEKAGLQKSFLEEDIAKAQGRRFKEGQIMDTIFKSTPGGLFNLSKQEIVPGTQRHEFSPEIEAQINKAFGGVATPSYNSKTSAGGAVPVRKPVDNSPILNPDDWVLNPATGDYFNIRSETTVNPKTLGAGSPASKIVAPAVTVPPLKKNPIIEEILRSIANPQPNTSNIPRGWEIGPDGNPRQKR